MALCLLSKQILLTEMAIIIHGSSAGVQDKHFIRLLPPNKMTLHRRGPCLDMWIMHAVCLRTEAGGGNTALIVLLKTSWRLKCRIMVFIVKNKVWVVTGQRVCSKVTEHKKKKKKQHTRLPHELWTETCTAAGRSCFTSLSLFEAQHDGGPSTPIFQKLRPGCLMRAYPSADILLLDRPLAAPKEQATQRISLLQTRANAVKLSGRSKPITAD